jgi:hypothetical protein
MNAGVRLKKCCHPRPFSIQSGVCFIRILASEPQTAGGVLMIITYKISSREPYYLESENVRKMGHLTCTNHWYHSTTSTRSGTSIPHSEQRFLGFGLLGTCCLVMMSTHNSQSPAKDTTGVPPVIGRDQQRRWPEK